MATKAELIAEVEYLRGLLKKDAADKSYWVNETYRLRAWRNQVMRAVATGDANES